MLMLSAILLAGPALAQTVTVAVVSQTNTFTAPVTFSDTLTATVGGSVSNSANLGGVAAASWAKLTAGAQTFAGGSTQAMDQASLTNLLIYDTLVMSNSAACPATPTTGSKLFSSNNVLMMLNADGMAKPVDVARVITQSSITGQSGFILGNGFGPMWWTSFSDSDAYMQTAFFVRHAGTYKLACRWQNEMDNTGKTMSTILYIASGAADAVVTYWNAFYGDWDIAIPNARMTMTYSTFPTAIVLPDNSWVGVHQVKDDNAGGANGQIWVYEYILVRQ